MMNATLRLGFYYHIPVVGDNNCVCMPGFLGRFLDGLAGQCNHLACFLHEAVSPASRALCDYTVRSTNISWINLGGPRSAVFCSFYPFPFLKHFYPYRDQLDALLLRGPTPLLPPLAHAAGKMPVILLLVGDYLESSADSSQPAWRKSLIRLWANWYTDQQLKIARNSLTFVNSRKLYRQLEPFVSNLRETRTTTLENGDFFERDDTCLQRPIRLLYTGRYSISKGLFEIVEALALLIEQGEDVLLDLVGWPSKAEEHIVDQLMTLAKSKGVAERVLDHGYQPVGPDLFAFYRRADIYVLASRSSFEGFPRTIWEAMAQSLPVVATSVGSIPDYLTAGQDALIVSPKSSQALVDAVKDLIGNSELRKKLIRNGYCLAKENQVDKRSAELVAQIEMWLSSRKLNGS